MLISYYYQHNKLPSYRLKSCELGVSPAVVREVFGTWNAAIEYSGLTPRKALSKIETTCNECDTSLTLNPSAKRKHNFCSKSCSAKFKNRHTHKSAESRIKTSEKLKGRTLPLEHRIKISQSRKGLTFTKNNPPYSLIHYCVCGYCSKIFISQRKTKKFCSNECRNRTASKRMSDWLRKNRKHIKGPHNQSYMEQSFEQWLQQNGMSKGISGYLSEVHFFNENNGKNGWADFVFPRNHLIVELDGTHHIKRIHLDKVRDSYLNDRGWDVIRITHKEFMKQTKKEYLEKVLGFK